MVDPIEVKLDEIEDHVLKTQADVDRLMRDFSKPEKGKELLGHGGGGGGFLDQLVGKISGKGGAMSAALAGGMAAGGIVALVQIIADAISNSKILMTVLGTIGKALGLLIDIILLPFLPILTTGIIWLFQGIMAFHRLWTTIWNSKAIQTLNDGLKTLGGLLAKGAEAFFKIGIDFLTAKAAEAWTVLLWIWDLITKGIPANFALALSIGGMVWDFLKWLWDILTTNAKVNLKMILSAGGAAFEFLTWLWNTITSGGANLAINITESVTSAATGAASAVGGAVSDPLGWLGGVASGGWLKGETEKAVPTSNKSSTSTNNINIYGYTDQKLVQTIETTLRRQNNRYNV